MRRLLTSLAAAAALSLAGAGAASGAEWEPAPLPTPPGGTVRVPVGFVGDLSFWAPNRGLMTVAGNNSVKGGLYSWNGESWHQLATVCGGGANARIAWAGPTEFWTITAPSAGSSINGTGLCHFRDGAVVGSYSVYNVPEFSQATFVNAATCRGPNDCWFGGKGGLGEDGTRPGAFHLHWDGADLTVVRNGQGRGVSDLITHGGALLESTFVGVGPAAQGQPPYLARPEAVPALLHRIDGNAFTNDPFTPAPVDGVPTDGTELRSLDTDGTTAWAVGGGANSGPATADGRVVRPPVAVRKDGNGPWQELALSGDVPAGPWFGAVAAVPGDAGNPREAWATVNEIEIGGTEAGGGSVRPEVAHIAADGTVRTEILNRATGAGARGMATAIDCPTAGDCWVATARGHLYRRTDRETYPRDDDPAFQGTISIRPNEAAAQAIPDDPPVDDSRLLAPPVVLPSETEQAGSGECPAPPALVTRVKATTGKLSKRQKRQANAVITLHVSFRLARRAKVGLRATRGTRTVARAKPRTLKPGKRRITVTVRRKSFPKGIKFSLKELTAPVCDPSSSDSVSTGTDS